MKKLVFGLIVTAIMSLSSNAQKVGVLSNGKFVITEDLSFLKERWSKALKDQNINDEIVDIEIKSGEYEDDNKNITTYYFILGQTKDNLVKISTELNLKISSELDASSGSVTCSGCMAGCSPTKLKIGWVCSLGCGDCKKTETVNF
jgi:hypothetical protein